MRPKKRRRNFEPNISADNPRVSFLAKGASAPRGTKKLDVGTACQPHIPKIYILSTKIPSPPSLISPARCSISHPGSNQKKKTSSPPEPNQTDGVCCAERPRTRRRLRFVWLWGQRADNETEAAAAPCDSPPRPRRVRVGVAPTKPANKPSFHSSAARPSTRAAARVWLVDATQHSTGQMASPSSSLCSSLGYPRTASLGARRRVGFSPSRYPRQRPLLLPVSARAPT
jgi:hypothetical protein